MLNGYSKGVGKGKVLIFLIILILIGYVAIKLGMPYYRYVDFKNEMEYWADITVTRGDGDYTDLKQNIKEKINEHDLPLEPYDVSIYPGERSGSLVVEAEYKVDVKFPGYTYRYHFTPRVVATP